MQLEIKQASEAALAEVMSWQYEPPYEFYSGDGRPPNNPERFFSVHGADGELVGFYYLEERGDALFYGLGLRPDLTGRGLGVEFVDAGLRFASALYGERRVILDVASFNERARRVYERAGFRVTGRHVRAISGWGDVEFTDLELQRPPDA
jgi:[ribosomal protein S18]-alanine N-acetyltransferase